MDDFTYYGADIFADLDEQHERHYTIDQEHAQHDNHLEDQFHDHQIGVPMSKKKTTRQRPTRRAAPARRKKAPARKASPAPSANGSYPRPLALIIYGPQGVGKTELCAAFPDSVFVHDPQEDGLSDLLAYGQCSEPLDQIEVESFEGLMNASYHILEGKSGGGDKVKTVVFESLTGFEKLCFQHHCVKEFEGDWSSKGFYAYQQGPVNAAKTDWPEWIDSLEALRRNGINVIVTGHTQVKLYSNPEGPDYDRYTPYLHKDIWQVAHRWAQAVIFYNFHTELEGKGIKKKPSKDGGSRFLYTSHSPAYDAKNRMGLDPAIPAGESGQEAYQALHQAILNAAR